MDYSYQLYSARNEPSLDTTLGRLKALGYTQVEGWGGQFADPAALAASVRNAGLTMPTAHMGFAQLEDADAALKIADTVGIETIYCSSPPAEYREGRGDWRRLAATLARTADAFAAAGKGFGYHNHHWEFGAVDGTTPMEIILDASPNMQWELDLCWVVKAGDDPVAWMKKLGSRMTAIHVKDIAPPGENADEDGWADVGHGTLDWPRYLAEARANTRIRYHVLEHDKPSDPFRFARRALESMKSYEGR